MKADENKCGAAQIQNISNKNLVGFETDSKLSFYRTVKVGGCQLNLCVMLKQLLFFKFLRLFF